jgi:hypothetical protein
MSKSPLSQLSLACAALALAGCSSVYVARRGGSIDLREGDSQVESSHDYELTTVELYDRTGVLLAAVGNWAERREAAEKALSRGERYFSHRSYDPVEFERINVGLAYGRGTIQPAGSDDAEQETFQTFRASATYPKLWLLPFVYVEGTSELRILTGGPLTGMWGGAHGDAVALLPLLPGLRVRGRAGVGFLGLTYGGYAELAPRRGPVQPMIQLGWERTGYYADAYDRVVAGEGTLRLGLTILW